MTAFILPLLLMQAEKERQGGHIQCFLATTNSPPRD